VKPATRTLTLGFGQVVAATEPKEGALELGTGAVGLDVTEIEAAELGLADRAANGGGRSVAFDVGDRPCGGRHGNAIANGRGAPGQRGAVNAQAASAASAAAGGWNGHVDRATGRREQLPQLGGPAATRRDTPELETPARFNWVKVTTPGCRAAIAATLASALTLTRPSGGAAGERAGLSSLPAVRG
jgi:hypothetical protein